MKTTELKIGDWVYFDNPAREVAKVVAIFNDVQLNIVRLKDNTPLLVVVSDIVPIPLTKEMLEKNGWIADGIHYDLQYKEKLYLIFCYTGEKKHRKIDSMEVYTNIGDSIGETDQYYLRDIRGVHELQHLLWALGMNDNLEI